jgi:hypothetical protein
MKDLMLHGHRLRKLTHPVTHKPSVDRDTHIPNKSRNVSIPVSAPEPDENPGIHIRSQFVSASSSARLTTFPVPIPVYDPHLSQPR